MEESGLESYGSLSNNQTLQQVGLSVEEVSTKEKLKLLCKQTYKIRRVKTKGALLVLAWNFLFATVFWYMYFEGKSFANKIFPSAVLFAITMPLAGWLADVYIGRYKIILYSCLLSWAALTLDTTIRVIQELVYSYQSINTVIVEVLYGAVGIGLGGFLSTIIQFGIDQLYDASTTEISAFIMWSIGAFCCPNFVFSLLLSYAALWNYQYLPLLGHLLSCVFLTLILISLFCCSNWLIKEPISQNPFKLIYRVTKYAIKNKYPQNRSAFTYSEDEVISRIDYGKSKYGGPFTIEQVEDVKTFYKALPLVIMYSILAGEMVAANQLSTFLQLQFVHPHQNQETQKRTDFSISNVIQTSVPVLILLNEVFLYPIFHRCCSCVTSIHKLILGIILLIATFLALMTSEILFRQSYFKANGHNATISCVFYQDQALATAINYNWMVLPDCLYIVSFTVMITGGLEFIFAQVPYAMKGTILGVTFCSFASSLGINSVMIIPLQRQTSIWGTGIISCGFWYALVHIIFCTIGCIAIAIITKHYTKRKREDILPNEHVFAERYYSN